MYRAWIMLYNLNFLLCSDMLTLNPLWSASLADQSVIDHQIQSMVLCLVYHLRNLDWDGIVSEIEKKGSHFDSYIFWLWTVYDQVWFQIYFASLVVKSGRTHMVHSPEVWMTMMFPITGIQMLLVIMDTQIEGCQVSSCPSSIALATSLQQMPMKWGLHMPIWKTKMVP